MKSPLRLFAILLISLMVSACDQPVSPPPTPPTDNNARLVQLNNQDINVSYVWKQNEYVTGDQELVELVALQLGLVPQGEIAYYQGTVEVQNNLSCALSATYTFYFGDGQDVVNLYLQPTEKKTVSVIFLLKTHNNPTISCKATNPVYTGACGGNVVVPNNVIDKQQTNVSKPCGIVISGNKIAVSQVPFTGYYNSVVKIWNSLADFKNNAAPARTLVADEPEAMAVSPRTGHLAVSENWDKKIRIYDANWQNEIAVLGTGDGLKFPRGVAFSSTGDLYVSDDYNHRILRYGFLNPGYSPTGDVVLTMEANSAVKDIALDAKGNLFVADYNYGVRRFDNTRIGSYFGIIPTFVMPPSKTTAWIGNAVNLELKNNLLYVSYHNQGQIKIFDPGTLQAPNLSQPNVALTGFATEQQDVAVDDDGNVYVADYMGNKVLMYQK